MWIFYRMEHGCIFKLEFIEFFYYGHFLQLLTLLVVKDTFKKSNLHYFI